MKIELLFVRQKELDFFIEERKNINRNVFPEKCLALIVELAELSNEVRSFKYWSVRESSEKDIILDEYVDTLHFLLSVGIDKGFNSLEIWPSRKSDYNLTRIFLETNKAINLFIENPSLNSYKEIWIWMWEIKTRLNFSNQDIIEAYFNKNDTNFNRQKNGY